MLLLDWFMWMKISFLIFIIFKRWKRVSIFCWLVVMFNWLVSMCKRLWLFVTMVALFSVGWKRDCMWCMWPLLKSRDVLVLVVFFSLLMLSLVVKWLFWLWVTVCWWLVLMGVLFFFSVLLIWLFCWSRWTIRTLLLVVLQCWIGCLVKVFLKTVCFLNWWMWMWWWFCWVAMICSFLYKILWVLEIFWV